MKNFKIKYIWLYSFILLLSFSCYSKLKITVDTFDRNAFMNSHDYKASQSDKIVERIYNKIEWISNYENGLLGYESLIFKDESIPTINKKRVVTDIKSEMASITREPLEKYINTLNIYFESTDSNKLLNVKVLKSSELQADLTLKYMFNEIDKLLGTKTKLPSYEIEGVSDVNKDLILSNFGNSILGDPMASLITRAPEKYWRKYKKNVNIKIENDLDGKRKLGKSRYNRIKAQTFFGNADIAVKMDNPGSFTIKGVRMDATESIKTSFKVLNQGIKYMSFAAGIPIQNNNKVSPSGGNSQETTSIKIPNISDNEILKNEAFEIQKRFNNLTRGFLSVYFAQIKTIESIDPEMEPDKLKESNAILKTAYDVFKSQTKLSKK